MTTPLLTFPALYLATMLMLMGTGAFNTYIALYLNQAQVSATWIGGMIAFFYAGMVVGAKVGQLLITRVGHIRTYVTCAGLSTIIVLLHLLIESTAVWMALRFILGLVMMSQYMVIESWLNEQAENSQRGIVFAGYMIAVSIGQVIGQLLLIYFPDLNFKPLLLVAIFFSASLIPVAMTRRVHPAQLVAAPLEIKYFWTRIPQSLVTVFLAGVMNGSFYGLGPVYASQAGLSTAQVSVFIAVGVAAGFVAQWPIGWISDRMDRSRLIQTNAIIMAVLAVPLWGFFNWSYAVLLTFSFMLGVFLFTFYPLAVAFANDNVEQPKRVALSGLLLATFGIGASIGPVLTGMAMKYTPGALYIMFSAMTLLLVLWVRPSKTTGEHLVDEAPTQFVPMTEHPVGAVMIDPRVDTDEIPDEAVVDLTDSIGAREDAVGTVFESAPEPEPEPEQESEPTVAEDEPPRPQ
ncbi:MFS transporter [Neisseriaceae bacterium CLB008]